MNHQPLKVTIYLSSPMKELKDWLHLDSLLAWSRVNQAMEDGYEGDFSIQHDLPVARLGKNEGQWCFAASRFFYDIENRFVRHYIRTNKPKDHVNALEKGLVKSLPNQFNTGSGKYKNYLNYENFMEVDVLVAYCIGDKEAVEQLLSRIDFIGGRRSRGSGRVDAINVEVDKHAYNRVLSRHLPFRIDNCAAICRRYRAPYWERVTEVAYRPKTSNDLESCQRYLLS